MAVDGTRAGAGALRHALQLHSTDTAVYAMVYSAYRTQAQGPRGEPTAAALMDAFTRAKSPLLKLREHSKDLRSATAGTSEEAAAADLAAKLQAGPGGSGPHRALWAKYESCYDDMLEGQGATVAAKVRGLSRRDQLFCALRPCCLLYVFHCLLHALMRCQRQRPSQSGAPGHLDTMFAVAERTLEPDDLEKIRAIEFTSHMVRALTAADIRTLGFLPPGTPLQRFGIDVDATAGTALVAPISKHRIVRSLRSRPAS